MVVYSATFPTQRSKREVMDRVQHDQPAEAIGDSDGHQRTEPRDSLFLSARFRVKGDDHVEQVRIRNLSAGGLMAEIADDIDPDTPVEIEVRGIGWIAGTIAWRAVGRVGIAFDKQVDPKKARKPVGRPTKSGTKAPLKQ
jgi:hypothetical protein